MDRTVLLSCTEEHLTAEVVEDGKMETGETVLLKMLYGPIEMEYGTVVILKTALGEEETAIGDEDVS